MTRFGHAWTWHLNHLEDDKVPGCWKLTISAGFISCLPCWRIWPHPFAPLWLYVGLLQGLLMTRFGKFWGMYPEDNTQIATKFQAIENWPFQLALAHSQTTDGGGMDPLFRPQWACDGATKLGTDGGKGFTSCSEPRHRTSKSVTPTKFVPWPTLMPWTGSWLRSEEIDAPCGVRAECLLHAWWVMSLGICGWEEEQAPKWAHSTPSQNCGWFQSPLSGLGQHVTGLLSRAQTEGRVPTYTSLNVPDHIMASLGTGHQCQPHPRNLLPGWLRCPGPCLGQGWSDSILLIEEGWSVPYMPNGQQSRCMWLKGEVPEWALEALSEPNPNLLGLLWLTLHPTVGPWQGEQSLHNLEEGRRVGDLSEPGKTCSGTPSAQELLGVWWVPFWGSDTTPLYLCNFMWASCRYCL